MAKPYNAANWYWIIAGNTTQVYSSARMMYVPITDQTYQNWTADGTVPTNIDSFSSLMTVLTRGIAVLLVPLGQQSGNFNFDLPAGACILTIVAQNLTVNDVRGGLYLGTTPGANDVGNFAIPGNGNIYVTDATLKKRVFSFTASQTIYASAGQTWNGATILLYVTYEALLESTGATATSDIASSAPRSAGSPAGAGHAPRKRRGPQKRAGASAKKRGRKG